MPSSLTSEQIRSAPIAPTLWSMTWPVIFGIATLISFNVVDTFFISLLGTKELAAVGFTFPITFIVISLTIGLGIGTSAVIAKHVGANEAKAAKQAGSSALYLAAILVACLSLIFYGLNDAIFLALGAEEALLPLINQYMHIWYAGSVMLVVPMVGNSVLRAVGDTKTPALIMGAGGLLNAVLDPLLIFGLGPFPALGIQGAALASVFSWSLGCILILVWLIRVKKTIDLLPESWSQFVQSCRRLLKIALPASAANMLTPLAMAIMTAMVASHGAEAVAGYSAGMRLESLASIFILALSMSLPPFISQNFGAGQIERIKQAYCTALRWVLWVQFGVYFLLIALSPLLQEAFAREASVAQILALFLWFVPLGYGLQGWIILTSSAFNALHLPKQALFVNVIRLFVTLVPFAYVGNMLAGLTGLFIATLIANLLAGIFSYAWFIRSIQDGN